MFKHMCCNFDHWWKFLKLPVSKLISHSLNKLQENIVESALSAIRLSLCELRCVWFEYYGDDVGGQLTVLLEAFV